MRYEIYTIKEGLSVCVSVCLYVCMYPSGAHSFGNCMKLAMETPWKRHGVGKVVLR